MGCSLARSVKRSPMIFTSPEGMKPAASATRQKIEKRPIQRFLRAHACHLSKVFPIAMCRSILDSPGYIATFPMQVKQNLQIGQERPVEGRFDESIGTN